MTAAGRRRVQRGILGAGLAGALVLSAASVAEAADTPTPSPTASTAAASPAPTGTVTPTASPTATPTATPTASPTVTPTASPTPTPTATPVVIPGVLTIKTRTAGTGTNFSGTYRVQQGTVLVPALNRVVDLQRKTPTGWDTIAQDAADANGNLVFGTVRSHYVQTWRLISEAGTTDPAYAVSAEVKVAKDGRAVSTLKFPTVGSRVGRHVAFTGYLTYRSWWITSGPDAGEQGFVAPLKARVYLQYLSGKTWRTKTSVLTEDRQDAGVNAYVAITTATAKARSWRLYYPGSSARTSAVSKTIVR